MLNKLLEFSKPEVSFVAKIDELHEDNIRLIREVSERKHKIAIESERRRTAEVEANQLKATVQQLQMDNGKLRRAYK